MMNYACDFSQSEKEKYFEWVIKINELLNEAECYVKNYADWPVTHLKTGN